MQDIDPKIARRIIDTVGGNGTPPEVGFNFFTAGLDTYLSVVEYEYLSTFIKMGGSAFKIVVGIYGGGKTHFLYCVRDLAWKHNFVVSYVRLSPSESPFHKLESVYCAIVKGLMPPLSTEELLSGYEQGIENFLKSWFSRKYIELKNLYNETLNVELNNYINEISCIENINFSNAVKSAFKALLTRNEDDFLTISQWLKGEGFERKIHAKYKILQRIDQSNAFSMIRSLVQWIKQIGYSGLVILLDEAERIPSLSRRQREQHLNNLREVIDECGHTAFQNVMIFYAVPDENFLDGRTQIYEALKQRVATIFDDEINPTGVKIMLENLNNNPIELLNNIGNKLSHIYEIAYGCKFDKQIIENAINTIAKESYEQRFGDMGYKRLFVQNIIHRFHLIRSSGKKINPSDLRM